MPWRSGKSVGVEQERGEGAEHADPAEDEQRGRGADGPDRPSGSTPARCQTKREGHQQHEDQRERHLRPCCRWPP